MPQELLLFLLLHGSNERMGGAMRGNWDYEHDTTPLHDHGVSGYPQKHLQRRYITGKGKTTSPWGLLIGAQLALLLFFNVYNSVWTAAVSV